MAKSPKGNLGGSLVELMGKLMKKTCIPLAWGVVGREGHIGDIRGMTMMIMNLSTGYQGPEGLSVGWLDAWKVEAGAGKEVGTSRKGAGLRAGTLMAEA
jgi:hypothetical protein